MPASKRDFRFPPVVSALWGGAAIAGESSHRALLTPKPKLAPAKRPIGGGSRPYTRGWRPGSCANAARGVQLAEVVPCALFVEILLRIERLRPRPPPFSA
jgi:hypothetical protein